jgi:hypothetical protein
MPRPHWSDRPWHAPDPPRGRAYAFKRRGDRQRIAQGLGAGRGVAEVAAAERCAVADIDRLLHDPGFQALVRHWEALAALDPAARLARLTAMAMELLELAVAAGDLRAAMLVTHEARHGRDPARTLAAAVERRLTAGAAGTPAAPAAPPAAAAPAAPAASAKDSAPAAPAPTATPPEAAREPFAFCAATLGCDARAARLAEIEAGRVAARLARIRRSLAAKLVAECERAGTALPADPAAHARSLGRALRRDPAAACAAASHLDRHRHAFAQGQPPPAPPAVDSG